jgi:hypothetical protein
MTSYTYKFQVGYTKLGVATSPSAAPTINVIDADSDVLLVTAGVTTASVNMPGVYNYSYTSTVGLNLTGLFHTTDTSVDQQDLFSIDINLTAEPAATASIPSGARNSYVSRGEFLNWIATLTATSTVDDAVIDEILEQASRYCDEVTGRRFYPLIATKKFDISREESIDDILVFNDDLLELFTFTNGDLTVIPAADYILHSVNDPPYWGLELRDITSVSWEPDANDSLQQVLSVYGLWGYHPEYSTRGWSIGGTLGADIADTTTLSFTMTAGHLLYPGQIVQIGAELFNVETTAATACTFAARGDNGSTAATHLDSSTVYIWNTYKPARSCTFQIAQSIYKNRFGENMTGIAKVTAAGVVVTPQDVSQLTHRILLGLMRIA